MSLRSAPPLEGLRDYSFDQSVMLLSRIGAMSGEGQNEQVPPYSMCIRTAFVVCIRRGEITGAASRGKQPDRSSEDELDPCRCFWNKPADRLFLRSQPRLLGQRRYQYPYYQTTRTRHGRNCSSNKFSQLRKRKYPLQMQSARGSWPAT